MKSKLKSIAAAAVLALIANTALAATDNSAAIEAKVSKLLSAMTIEEKIGQITQLNQNQKGLDSLTTEGKTGSVLNMTGTARTNKLQRIAVEQSGLHIPVLFGYDVIHGYRTTFPIPLAIASSWDPSLAELSARIAAKEASAAGVRWTFAPMVDIARDPRWGRIAEGNGEDPFLGSKMATAYVRGFQGKNLSASDSILACAKHFVAYGAAEGGRDYNSVDISERTLREVYLPPFKAAVDAGVVTFMSAFNSLNGVPASANPYTLDQILRREWNFKGFVVSDWHSVIELVNHGIAADSNEAAIKAFTAGVHMDMADEAYPSLLNAVKQGRVPVSMVDDAVRRILRAKFQLGLFDTPYTDPKRETTDILTTENIAAARRVAQSSMVLLKNDARLLPLSTGTRAIAVIGPLADAKNEMLGPWAAKGRSQDAVTVLEGIRSKVQPSTRILYAKGADILGTSSDGFAKALDTAQEADVVVMVLGESAHMSGEASSRTSLDLPGAQQQLLEAIAGTGKPIVLVVMSGRPLTIPWAAEHVTSIIQAWFLGIQSGNAIADVVFGDVNPSGKLPVSFPRSLGQVPIYYSHLNTGRPFKMDVKYSSKYIDSPNDPLYPFGYGLSYTKFAYSNLLVNTAKTTTNGSVVVSADIQNTGERAGEEIAQLYVGEQFASISRPVKELKGFQRVSLRPGEKRTVEFTLPAAELAFWHDGSGWQVEPGVFKIWVGPNSSEGLEGKFEVVSHASASINAEKNLR